MISVSADWLARIRQPHKIWTGVLVYTDFLFSEVLTRFDTDDMTAASVPVVKVVDGTVTLDRTSKTRGTMDLTVVSSAPSAASDLFAPLGNVVQPWRGVVRPNGDIEAISLGVFRVEECESVGDGVVRITGADQSAAAAEARLEAPYTQAAGTPYDVAVQALIQQQLGAVQIGTAAPTDFVTPTLFVDEQGDPWQTVTDWASSIGYEVYFDRYGALTFGPEPVLGTTDAVWSVEEGPSGVLLGATKKWTRHGAVNRVIAIGENPTTGGVYRGVATDTDAASPTQYGGAFGRVPEWYSSPLFTSNTQAQAAAEARLSKRLGTTRSVSFTMVPNVALEPGDIVSITRTTLGLDAEDHMLESITYPMAAAGDMRATTRSKQVLS